MAFFFLIIFIISLIGLLFCAWQAKQIPSHKIKNSSRLDDFMNDYFPHYSSHSSDQQNIISTKIIKIESQHEIISACHILMMQRIKKL